MPRVNATSSVERGFVSTRTQTDSAYTELRGGGAAKNPFGFARLLAALDFMQRHPGDRVCLR
jgi:hypothetical protein